MPYLDHVVLLIGAKAPVVLKGSVAISHGALSRPHPWIRMGKDTAVLLKSRINPGDKSDVIVRFSVSRGIEKDAIWSGEVLMD